MDVLAKNLYRHMVAQSSMYFEDETLEQDAFVASESLILALPDVYLQMCPKGFRYGVKKDSGWHSESVILKKSELMNQRLKSLGNTMLSNVAKQVATFDANLDLPKTLEVLGSRKKQKKKLTPAEESKLMELSFNMLLCPPGTFRRGCEWREYHPGLQITWGYGQLITETTTPYQIEKPFWAAEDKVTQGLYEFVMGKNPSYYQGMIEIEDKNNNPDQKYVGIDSARPVETITWYDALEFCNKLSVYQGLDSCYELTNPKKSKGHIVSATIHYDPTKNGYRLLSDPEWEYISKADRKDLVTNLSYLDLGVKTTKTQSWGDEIEIKYLDENSSRNLDRAKADTSWTQDDLRGGILKEYREEKDPCPVKHEYYHTQSQRKKPNAWGFYNLFGNVEEWCYGGDIDKPILISRGTQLFDSSTKHLLGVLGESQKADTCTYAIGFRIARNF
jgi:formylglycine-generating enzyme required for sulfatase activity